MKSKKKILGLILLSVLCLLGCSKEVKVKETGMYMRNLFEISVNTEKKYSQQVEKRLSQAVELLRKMDSSLNNLSPISEISAVNNNADKRSVAVSEELYSLIKKSVNANVLTSGYFDIAWQPLIDLFSKTKYPNYKYIFEAKSLCRSSFIKLDNHFNKIQFANPGVKISIELVKTGFAIDQVAAILKKDSLQDFKINSGSTYLVSDKITPLEILLSKDNKITLKLANQAVSTIFANNPNLENYKVWTKYLDIKTSTENIDSVTVVAPNAFTAQALSAAFLLMGTEKSKDLLNKINGTKNNYYAIFLIKSLDDKDIIVDTRKK